MTVLTAYIPLNMQNVSVTYGAVSSYSSSHITIVAGSLSATYRGNFTYDVYGNVFGQLHSYETRNGGTLTGTVTGGNLDAYRVMTLVQSGNGEGVYSYVFAKSDTMRGSNFGDAIRGFAGADSLFGNGGNDRLNGGIGKDTLSGGSGADHFDFNSVSETGNSASTADTITDFARGQDKINLATIDAFSPTAANNVFVFRGTAGFSNSSAGEVRFQKVDLAGTSNDYTMVYIDTDADAASEAAIRLTGLISLNATDFVL